jgi:folylpolyglutamate synthase/dihydropteroate synthase
MRSRTVDEWKNTIPDDFSNFEVHASAKSAYQTTLESAQDEDLVLVFGSFFLVGELLRR